jgi:hypothetical protein
VEGRSLFGDEGKGDRGLWVVSGDRCLVGKRRSGFVSGEGRSLFDVEGKGDRVLGGEGRSLFDEMN